MQTERDILREPRVILREEGPPLAESNGDKIAIGRVGLDEIPGWLMKRPNLRHLIISDNPLGIIVAPRRIPEFVSKLAITNCSLRLIPQALPEGLKSLDISDNHIDDPSGLNELPATLRTLIMKENRITILPKRFPLRILVKLVLDSNDLTYLPASLPNTLRHLSFANNRVEELPSRLPYELKTLNASYNKIAELDLSVLGKCKNLTKLDISENFITDLEVGFLPCSLRILLMINNGFNLSNTLVIPPSIRRIDFASNNITDVSRLKFSTSVPIPAADEGLGRPVLHDTNVLRRLQRERLMRPGRHVMVRSSDDEEEEQDGEGVILNLSDNPHLTHIGEGTLPINLKKLEINDCHLEEIPQGLRNGCASLQLLTAIGNRISILRVDDLPLSLEYLNLGLNQISEIVESKRSGWASVFARSTTLKTVDISNNLLKSIPSSWLLNNLAGVEYLNLSNNIIDKFPSPLLADSKLRHINLHHNVLRDFGTERLPPSLQMIDMRYNLVTALSGPALLGLTVVSNLFIYLDGNTIRYASPQIREHFERLFDGDEDARRNFFSRLPIGLVYSDTQSVHRHAIQEGMRDSLTALLKTKILENAPPLEQVAREMILETPISKSILISIFSHAAVGPDLIPRNISREELLRLFTTVGESGIPRTEEPSLIAINDDDTVSFADVLRISWAIVRAHPERAAMISNINTELGQGEPPCITGLVGALIGGLAGFEGPETSLIQIRISESEQLAAIIEVTGAQPVYSVEGHRMTARAEMLERGFSEETIALWISNIE